MTRSIAARLRVVAVAVALAGCSAGSSTSDASVTTSATPTAATGSSPSPAASPTDAGPSRIPFAGEIEPGEYLVDSSLWTAVPYTLTLPAGWVAENDGRTISKHPDEKRELSLNPFILDEIYRDTCGPGEQPVGIGPTVDDLVTALQAQIGPAKSAPAEVDVGGQPGTRIDLTVPPEIDIDACRLKGFGLQLWLDVHGDKYQVLLTDGTISVYMADVDASRFVLTTQLRVGSDPAEIAEMKAIVASIRFDPALTASPRG